MLLLTLRWLQEADGFRRPTFHQICQRPDESERANVMLFPGPHVPPQPLGASHKVEAAPPETGTFFSLPSAKNPTHFPSCEKNGL